MKAFAERGSQVVFLDVADANAHALGARIRPAARIAPVYVHCDLTDSTALELYLKEMIGRFRGAIDVVVNNAGNDSLHTTRDVTPEFWDQCMAVNLKHQFFVSRA